MTTRNLIFFITSVICALTGFTLSARLQSVWLAAFWVVSFLLIVGTYIGFIVYSLRLEYADKQETVVLSEYTKKNNLLKERIRLVKPNGETHNHTHELYAHTHHNS